MISPRRLLPVPLLLIALAGAGCGDETTAKDLEGGETTASTTAGASAGSSSAAVKELVAKVGTDVKVAPKVTSPEGTPPSQLVKKDVVEGSGTPAKLGDTVEVRYTLLNWGGDQTPVDDSWARTPNSSSFELQEGGLIPGWIKGVPGMKPGGRRVLVVPPADGYGTQGTPDGRVPSNGTLIFVVDLVSAR